GEGWLPYVMVLIIPLLFILTNKLANDLKEVFLMNLVLMYQFVEMQFMLDEGWKALWMLAIIPLFFFIEKKVKEYQELLFIANLLLIYQFIEMHIAWKAVDHVQILYVFAGIVVTAGLFWYGHVKLQRSLPLFLANLALSIQWVFLLLYTSGVNNVSYYVATTFILGVVLQVLQSKFSDYPDVLKIIGIIFHFSMALVLTSPYIWLGFEQAPRLSGIQQGEFETYPIESMIPSVLFGTLYALYGFYLVKKEQLLGIAIVGVMVLRYYTDYSFKFLDKSIAFMIGGIILMALGYWFERTRRKEAKKNGKHPENK
ncbi:MAG: hypothetical protein Q8906_16665, partial [Bacillota bacterium]|nr:hypothetical protein [Bacillota bacterium]